MFTITGFHICCKFVLMTVSGLVMDYNINVDLPYLSQIIIGNGC